MNEAKDTLYMPILQELDRFCYAIVPHPNMAEWRDQGEEATTLYRIGRTSTVSAGGTENGARKERSA